MAKKFKPPHDEDYIAAQRAIVAGCKKDLEEEEACLEQLLRENREAHHAEELRKARVMTPTMLKVLNRLAKGEFILALPTAFRPEHRTQVRIGSEGHWFALDKRVYVKIATAEYIEKELAGNYVISDEGRAALAAAKKSKGEK